MRAWFCAALLLLTAIEAAAERVVLQAVERGVFREDGSYELGPEAAYTAGHGELGEERSVFVFDVSGVEGPVGSATLRIWNQAGLGIGLHPHWHLIVYGVSSDPGMLAWEPELPAVTTTLPTPMPSLGTFWDLGSGQILGSSRVPVHGSGFVEVLLDRSILRVLERSPGLVAFGASLGPPQRRGSRGAAAEHRVFAPSQPGAVLPAPELVLTRSERARGGGPVTIQVEGRSQRARRGRLPSLAAALDVATQGDTVRIAPGVYAETILMKEGVDVIGAGADQTLIELAAGVPDVRCADASLSGVAIFRVGEVNAIDCTNGASPTLTEVAVSSPRAAGLADSNATFAESQIYGTIDAIDSVPELTGNLIDASLGGVNLTFDSEPTDGSLLIERNRIRGRISFLCNVPAGSLIIGNHFSGYESRPYSVLQAAIRFLGSGDLGLVASNTFQATGGVVLGSIPRPFLPLPCDGEKHVTLANNILAFGDAGVSLDGRSTAALVANNVFGNVLGFVFPRPNDYVGLPDPTGVDGNLSVDPLFTGSSLRRPSLLAESPMIDAGANEFAATELDLHGQPRVVDGSRAGVRTIDIGAAEHQPDENARVVEVSVATNAELHRFGFRRNTLPFRPVSPERTLCFGRSFDAAFLSDAEFDPVRDLDPGTVEIEGVAPVHPRQACRASDVDDDGFEDLECRFPFEAIDALPSLPVKDVCLHGLLVDGSAVRGCQRMTVYRVRSSAVQRCVRAEHTAGPVLPFEPVVFPLPGSRLP